MRLNGGALSLSAKWVGISVVCVGMASCATSNTEVAQKKPRSKEYFSEKEYGVKASPRVVADGQPVPKGGGRFMVGDPYQVKGKTYVPKEDPRYNKSGLASWYGSAFHGRQTANGEVYDTDSLTAAHPTFPLPSYARVTNLDNGSSMIVRVNDRGPYHPGRIIDVSEKTAQLLDIKRVGTANVNVQYVGRARMDGHDEPFLMASYVRKGDRLPSFRPDGQIAPGVMVASNRPLRDDLQSYGSSLPRPAAESGRMPNARVAASAPGASFPATDSFSTLPNAGPKLGDRPTGNASRSEPRVIASIAPAQAQQPQVQSRQAPVYAAAVAAPLPSKPQAKAPAQARSPVAQPTATAYANDTRAREPQVIFGNMVLQAPSPSQKPVR